MGDSISEGSISAFLKKAGDAVAMDETIAQIETDKVTVDIRAAVAGTLSSVSVKVDDTVVPGQVIAVITEVVAAAAPAASATATPTTGGPTSSSSAASPSGAEAHAPPHRVAGIHFPPRRTGSGERVSDLPAAQAIAFAAQHASSQPTVAAHSSEAHAPAAAPPAAAKPPPAPTPPAKAAATSVPAAAGSAAAAASTAAPAKKFAPFRRQLSEREWETINLGGASP